MGEAYTGLTIRIGADVTDLKKAMRSSNAAINDVQKQLRSLQRAAKIDPGNLTLFTQKMDLMGDKARASARNMTLLREQAKQLNQTSLKNLSKGTKDAALNAQVATREYAKVCDQIARLKREVGSNFGLKGKALDKFVAKTSGFEETIQKLKELGATQKQVTEYVRLYMEHARKANALDNAKQINDWKNLKTNIAVAEVELRGLYLEMARMITLDPTATLTKEFRVFRQEMERADRAADELKAELKTIDEALNMDPRSLDAARLKMQNMQEQVRLNVAQMEKLNEQMDELRRKDIDKASNGIKDLKQEIIAAESKVAALNQELDEANEQIELLSKQDTKQAEMEIKRLEQRVESLDRELDEAVASANRLGDVQTYRNLHSQYTSLSAATVKLRNDMDDAHTKASLLRGSFQQLGWAMYSTATPMLMMFGSMAIQAAEDVDTAYRNMRKTVNGTEEQFEELKQAAIDFSRTHVTSADQILEIEALGGQLGIATEKLGSFAETVSNIEIATNLDADTAAEQLGQLAGILKDMSQDDFDNFGDALVRLGNNNATLEDKIMNVMLRIASMGTIVGFSTTELLAWSTSVAATGQGAEAAGTAISKTMSDIETAVGKGGASLKAFADIANMSAEDFANTWSTDPSSAMYAFINGLKSIEANGGSADSALQSIGITSVRQKQAIEGLMQTIGGLNDNLAMSQNAWDGVGDKWGAAGDAAREAERKAEGFSGAIKILRNNAQVFGMEVGESIAPKLIAMGEGIAGLTQAYSDLAPGIKTAINMVALFLAALGPVAVASNAVVSSIGDLMKGISSRGTAWAVTVKNMKGVSEELVNVSATGERTAKTWDEMTKKQKLAAVGAGALQGALYTLAAGAVIAGISHIVTQFKELAENQEKAKKIANELKSSLTYTGDAASAYGDDLEDATLSMAEFNDKTIEMIDNIKERNKQSASEIALFRKQTDVFKEYADATGLSQEQLTELSIGLDAVNDKCGTSYELTTNAAGGYEIMADGAKVAKEEIYKLIDAQIAQARAEVAAANYKEMYMGQQEALNVLAEATETYQNDLAELNEQYRLGKIDQETYKAMLAEIESKYNAAKSAAEGYAEAVSFAEEQMLLQQMAANGTADAFQRFVAENANIQAGVERSGQSLLGFCDQLEQTGISTEALATLTPEQLMLIGTAYDGTVESIIAAMAGMSGEVGTYGKQAIQNWRNGMSSETQGAIDAALRITGMTLEEFYVASAEVGAYGEDAVRLYAKALSEGKDPAAASAAIVTAAAEGKLAEFDTESIGEDFAAGYARGINSKISLLSVGNAAWNLGSEALRKLKAAQQSNSPSKLTMGLGGDFAGGYAIGIEKDAYLAELEATRMVEQAVKAAQQTIDGNGLTMQARVAGDFASNVGASAGQVVNNSTSNNSNHINVYIEANDLSGINAVEEFVQLLERSR